MDELETTAKLFEDVFNKVEYLCPICKKPMTEGREIVAFRLREKDRRYPYNVLHHHLNRIEVCSVICSERVSIGWDNPKNMELRKKLFSEICKDIADNSIKVQLAMKEVRSPVKKKRD